MSTLADELLQDFEDSGSDGEQDNAHLFAGEDTLDLGLKSQHKVNGSANAMDLDGDEEGVGDDDDEMAEVNTLVVDAEDEDEARAKVEKMQLAGVNDVRSVAVLMKTMEPVLEVSHRL